MKRVGANKALRSHPIELKKYKKEEMRARFHAGDEERITFPAHLIGLFIEEGEKLILWIVINLSVY